MNPNPYRRKGLAADSYWSQKALWKTLQQEETKKKPCGQRSDSLFMSNGIDGDSV
jgi:hypothetical protein